MLFYCFAYDGATIGRRLYQGRQAPDQQGFHGLIQEETGGFPYAKCDVIHRAAITQNAIPVDHKDVRGGLGPVQICNDVFPIDQDQRQAADFRSLGQRFRRLDPIRGDRQQKHLFAPLDEHGHNGMVGALRMRAFTRPEVDDHDLAAAIVQTMESAAQVGQLKIRSGAVNFHYRDYTVAHMRASTLWYNARMKKWQFWLGIVISVVFIWLALRGLRLDQILGHAANRELLVAPARHCGLFCGGVGTRLALALPAQAHQKNTYKTMFPITTIGYMGNNIYPARAGEVLRAVILKRRENVSISASLATIIVERIFDGVVMLSFVFLNLPSSPG